MHYDEPPRLQIDYTFYNRSNHHEEIFIERTLYSNSRISKAVRAYKYSPKKKKTKKRRRRRKEKKIVSRIGEKRAFYRSIRVHLFE